MSVCKRRRGDGPLCETYNYSTNDAAACKHTVTHFPTLSWSVRSHLCFLMALWFSLRSVQDSTCVYMLSESSHEVHSALGAAALPHSLHPTPLTSHDHLLSRNSNRWAGCMCGAASLNSLIGAACRLNWPEKAEHIGHCCATSPQPFQECLSLSERLVELESFSPSWPLKVHAAVF